MNSVIKFKQNKSQNLLFLFSFLSLLFFASCRLPNQTRQNETSEELQPQQQPDQKTASFAVPPPDINLSKPLQLSNRAEDVALCENINRTIEQSEYANARWGVFVLSLKDGRVVCARDARQLFNPASIEKAITAIVALDKLGADFRYKTSIYAQNQIDADGSLNGDLTIYGTGAPDFDDDALNDLIGQLQAKGLKRIKGNIVGDDSYFKGMPIGDGWTWNDIQWHYGAEASALSYKENQAGVYMNGENGKPSVSNDLLQIHGELKPVESGHVEAFGLQRGLEDNQIYVWGNGNRAYGRISVHNPALLTAKTLKEFLVKKGIAVDGDFKSVDWKTENKPDVAKMAEIAVVESKPLGELIQRMNKHSVNLYGELLLRTIGKRFGDSAPDESREIQELRGDDAAGAAVIKKWLRDNNVAVEDIQIHDGSGLSRLDFLTPEAFGRALVYAAKSNFGEVFADSLPIAGTDGTLGGRLGNVKGKILAKTGSITFVNSLAGFAQANDEIFAFSIIGNNVTRKSDASRIVDRIAQSLVKRETNEEKAQK
ncbi:MAG: D-alanyl-D-alanine carboxypeptidase/D-alanyl-D-alanine-endopeptidase [Acidobacteriota bacterium]|nr:D-alanyl-D-alanine carboxypeptidase/D-alanyl-D-alanine-endopeptidase [Acidobacteriota bacterium]